MINSKFNFHFLSLCLTAIIVLLLGRTLHAQYEIPQRPTSDKSLIFDYSEGGVLNASEKAALNQKLIAYEGKTSTQIAIVIVQNLQDEDPNFLAVNWAHKWGIGQEGKDNGLIILMSKEDRRISIQNGYGLEEYMTDARSRQIIDNFIIPYFKHDLYYEGLNHGIDAIFRVLEGNFVEDGEYGKENGNIWPFLIMMGVMFFIFWLLSRNNRGGGKGGHRSRRSPFGGVIFTDFGRSTWTGSGGGFGGGGFGGGGFGGFGGGGFGGGGASGSW